MEPPDLPGHRIDAHLGRGGCSDVWLAWSRQAVPEPVAVKVVADSDPTAVAAWRAHAELLGRCAHPNLMEIRAVVPSQRSVLVVLPFLAGGSLADLLADGTLTEGELVALIEPVAGALAALHRHGAVHGDVKPANILLTTKGEPLLADALVDATADGSGSHARRATPGYLAPECAEPAGPPSPSGDVFALGVTAYEALTGVAPHRGGTAEVLAAAAEGAHRPLAAWPGVSPAVAEAVEAALDPDPTRRPDPVTLAEELRHAVEDGDVRLAIPAHAVRPLGRDRSRTVVVDPSPAPTPGARERGRWMRRKETVAAGAALALAVLAVVALPSPSPGGDRADRGAGAVAPPPVAPSRRCGTAGATVTGGRLDAGRALVTDLAGLGCHRTLRWRDAVLVVDDGSQDTRYAVGRVGDQVLAGDWDGDGRAGVAVYEPDRGRVLYADRLPASPGGTVRAGRVDEVRKGGQARVSRQGDGHDEVQVRPLR